MWQNKVRITSYNVCYTKLLRIVDVEGINDQYEAMINVSVVNCEILPRGVSGETKQVECEIVVLIECIANRYDNIESYNFV